jgi:purine-binding chemotaxis protein CheW
MAESKQRKGGRQESTQNASLNWEQVHRRLTAAQAALDRDWQLTPEESARALRDRAKALAREAVATGETGEFLEVVEFLVANERYGIESHHVREVYPVGDLTPMPCVPSYVLGVINMRGRVVSVVDLKRFFELPQKGLSDLNKAIIVSAPGMELGILADAVVAGLRRIRMQDLHPSLPTLTEIRAEYLRGVTGDRLVVLDAEKILSDPKLVVRQEVEP